MVVSGVTFDADRQLLDRIMTSSGDEVLKLLSQDDGEVIIVFCPVVSRMGTDVEAAMAQVTGKKKKLIGHPYFTEKCSVKNDLHFGG